LLQNGDQANNNPIVKRLKGCELLMGNPAQSYGASLAIWDSTSVTCHTTQMNALYLNPSQISQLSIYLSRRDEKLS